MAAGTRLGLLAGASAAIRTTTRNRVVRIMFLFYVKIVLLRFGHSYRVKFNPAWTFFLASSAISNRSPP